MGGRWIGALKYRAKGETKIETIDCNCSVFNYCTRWAFPAEFQQRGYHHGATAV